MKSQWMILSLMGLFFALSAGIANAQSATEATPPVAQSLVREGDFAVKLAGTLHLGSVGSETEAESALGSVGIAPKNGWIADYPVTPDILNELRDAVGEAAGSGRLSMNKEDALLAFQNLAAESGLPVVSATDSEDAAKEPERDYSQYTDPTIINNYYYDQGPPAVTYYAPPWDYYYLYSWVPHPFWWHSFWFSGFFILHDFHRVVIVKNNVFKVVTNHVFDRGRNRVVTVDHASRTSGRSFRDGGGTARIRDRNFSDSQTGARSIMERSRQRAGISNSGSEGSNRGTSGDNMRSSGSGSRLEGQTPDNRGSGGTSLDRGGAGASGTTRTDRRIEGGRIQNDSINSGRGSFRRSGSSGSREAPSSFRSPDGRGSDFNAPPRVERRAFGSSSGGGSGFSPSMSSGSRAVNSGGSREMNFQGSSPRVDRSFRAPSSSGRGSGEGFRGGSRSGSGRFVGGSRSGGSGSSGRGCRGRC